MMKFSFIGLHIIIFCLNCLVAMDRSPTLVLSPSKHVDNLDSRMRTLALCPAAPVPDTIKICEVQQAIEHAHKVNDVEAIRSIHDHLSGLDADETQWKLCSDQLLTSSALSFQWQNWYQRWVKWECQPTWREAVLSAVFFPQVAFLEGERFGNWDGNQAVNYSLAISAAHNNPQAQLYHLRAFRYLYEEECLPRDESDDETVCLNDRINNMFERKIATSETLMGQELVACVQIVGLPGARADHKESKRALEKLAGDSVTAFSKSIFHQKEESRKELRERAGDRGIRDDYLTAASQTDDREEKLRLLAKAGDLGLEPKWRLTRAEKDFQSALRYYLRMAESGDPEGYYRAALILLDKSNKVLTPEEQVLVVDCLKKGCTGGISGSDCLLRQLAWDCTMRPAVYGDIVQPEEKKAALRAELPALQEALSRARSAYNKIIKDLGILSKI